MTFFLLKNTKLFRNMLVCWLPQTSISWTENKTLRYFSKYLLCCKKEGKTYRFGMIWGWVNDDSIFSFGWAIVRMLNCITRSFIRLTLSAVLKFSYSTDLTSEVTCQWNILGSFFHFWSLKVTSFHSLLLYAKEQHRHSAQYLLFLKKKKKYFFSKCFNIFSVFS